MNEARAGLRRWAADRCYPALALTPSAGIGTGYQCWDRFLERAADEVIALAICCAQDWDRPRPWEAGPWR